MKTVYIAGSLTGHTAKDHPRLRRLYEQFADVCRQFGLEPYLPHQHSDPELATRLTPSQINRIDRLAVTQAYLVVAYVGRPSTGVGIEIEMAYHANKPVVLVYEQSALDQRQITRLVRGNPAVVHEIAFTDTSDATTQLADFIKTFAYKIMDEHLPEPLSIRGSESDITA